MYKAIYENPENKLGEKLDLKKGFKNAIFSPAIRNWEKITFLISTQSADNSAGKEKKKKNPAFSICLLEHRWCTEDYR